MTTRSIKKLILTAVFSFCALMGCTEYAFAEKTVSPKLEIYMPPISEKQDTHLPNTPQWDDELEARVTYDREHIIDEPSITWYRFNNHPLYDSNHNIIQETYYEIIGTGSKYKVTSEDIHHKIKVEAIVGSTTLIKETNPVEKRNYGKVLLNVVDNTNYGDTDGYIGYLDTRMQYTNDEITIFDVESDGSILKSGSNSEALNPDGYAWMVRYKGTTLVEQTDWIVYTIKPGRKVPLESVDINLISRTLTPLEPEYKLSTVISPDNAYIESVIYQSSNTDVATVSEDGTIHAVNNGEAIISVSVKGADSEFVRECNITVSKYDIVSEAIISEDSVTLELGNNDSLQLNSSVFPSTAEDYTTSWRSSDDSICSVNDAGIVKANAPGEAIVTFSVVQGDVSLIDTVQIKILPVPNVSSPEEWVKSSGKDLCFEFEGYSPDENTIVKINCANGRSETIYKGNYRIEGNKIIIDYNYLQYMPEGDASFSFEFLMSECESSNDNIADLGESHAEEPIVTSASYSSAYSGIISKIANAAGIVKFKSVADEDNSAAVSSTTGSKKILTASVKLASVLNSNILLKPGYTFSTCKFDTSLSSTESFVLETDIGFDRYFDIEDQHSSSDRFDFIVSSKGINTDKAYNATLYVTGSGKKEVVARWSISAADFVDLTGVVFSLDPSAEILSDSKSTCIITPSFSNGLTIDSEFLKYYSISFMEVSQTDTSHEYSGGPNYFKTESLYLNTSDFKLHCVANRNGTGYIRGILSLQMTDGTNTRPSKEIQKSTNATKVYIKLYSDVTRTNIQHLWSQNSSVGITYTIQGDFSRFLNEYGGSFSDNNIRLWYKKGVNYNPLTIGNGEFSVELINDSLANVTISYSLLRRLYLGAYPLYISFKYDGSDFSMGPWCSSTWSRNGNYLLSTFTIIKAGTPITGDSFNSEVWIIAALITLSASSGLFIILKKRKHTVNSK